MCKHNTTASQCNNNNQCKAATKWLTKTSHVLLNDNWRSDQPLTFDSSMFPNDARDSSLQFFFEAIAKNGKVSHLRLRNITFALKAINDFQTMLLANDHLTVLELCNISFECPSCESTFCKVLATTNTTIKTLEVIKLKMSQQMTIAIGKMTQMGTMQTLKLVNVRMMIPTDNVSDDLMNGLGKDGCIHRLELRNVRVSKPVLSTIIRCLGKNRHLDTLYLDQCGIDDSIIGSLCDLLSSKSNSMATLSLVMNDLDGRCIRLLKENGQLDQNRCLKTLKLSYNPIGNDGIMHLRDLLISNPTLESLSVSECEIWSPGCQAFIRALGEMQGLKRLVVDSEWESHAQAILDAMTKNKSLVQLWTHNSALLSRHDTLWKKINHYLHLNKAKRRILEEPNLPVSIWPKVLSCSSNDPSMMYHLLRNQPDVMNYATTILNKKGETPSNHRL